MQKGLLPKEHLHKLIDETAPSMRWNGEGDVKEWQASAREKLSSLLGLDEIAKHAVPLEIDIEFDKINDDGCREIRFRVATEKNYTVPCHLVIPALADKPLPVAITLQGHSTGMHISLGRPKWQGDEETCRSEDRDFVVRAVKEGICGIAVEQRCFGECGGSPTHGRPDCRDSSMRAIILGRTMVGERVFDVCRVIDAIERYFSHIIDVNKIICLGNSGGGTTTVYAAAIDERIKIAVPSCAVCRFVDSIGAMLHCECCYVPHAAKYFDMGDICALTAPRSLVVVSGESDSIFPIDGAKESVSVARAVYAAYGAEDKLAHVIGDGGHRFYADDAWVYINKALNK